MRFLIPAYAVAFLFVSVQGVRQSLRDEEPRWVVGAEIVLAVLALAGYLAYHLDYRHPAMVALWQGMAPVGMGAYACLVVRDLRSLEPEPEFSDNENVWVHTIAAFIGLAFVVPMAWCNLLLAYG